MKCSLIELMILMTALITPMFILASEVDGDEYLKASTGIAFSALAGAVMLGYRTWKDGQK